MRIMENIGLYLVNKCYTHIALQWILDCPDPFGQSSRKTMPDK